MSFNFQTPKTATGFAMPTSTPTAAGGAGDAKLQAKPSLFGTPTAPTGFSLATTAAPKTTPTLNFGIGSTPGTGVEPKLSFTATSTSSAATPQFNLGSTTSSIVIPSVAASTAPAITTAATASVASFAPILGSGTSLGASLASAIPKLTTTSLPAATTSSTGLTLGTSAAVAPQSTAVTTAAASTIPAVGTLTYAQLEDSINKWTIDLEEQGKFFINQAKELNAWDSLLVTNGERILSLNETIERVKTQQKQLDQELDFILAQQNELDELSVPLEKQLSEIPVTDQNRFQMYQLSEIIDSQLKQMSEDLKEIVEHLNESNKNEDVSDPVIQISRILNAHMNSLQWIDRSTAQISAQLEQISKLHEIQKKNSFNI